MDALTFIINVKSEGAISAVQQLKTSMAGLQSMAGQLKNISLVNMVQGLQQFTNGIKEITAPGADFQQSMADLSAITGITGKDLDNLGNAAREMGKKSGIGATQGAEAFKLLASNINIVKIGGVEGLKILQEKVITLAHAAGIDLPTAANAMSFALNEFQMPVSEAARVINVLGAGAKYGAAFIPDLAESLKNVGSVAHMAGMSIEETTGAIEILSQRGIKGAEAGVMLRNVLLMMQTRALPGVNVATQGFTGALKAMQKYLGDTTTLTHVFRRESLNAAEILISSADAVAEMGKKVTGTNVAYDQAIIRTNTYKHTVDEIRAKFDDFKISIFGATSAFMPWVEVIGEGTASFSQLVPAMWMFKEVLVGGVIPVIKTLVTGTMEMISCMEMATTAQEALNIAWMTNPIGVVIAGLALLGGALYLVSRNTRELSAAQKVLNELQKETKLRMAGEKSELDLLFNALRTTTQGTKERSDIVDELNRKFKDYLPNLDLESAKMEDIARAYKHAAAAMEDKARAEAGQEMLKKYEKDIIEGAEKVTSAKKAYDKAPKGGMGAQTHQAFLHQALESAQKELTETKGERDDLVTLIQSQRHITGNANNAVPTKKLIKVPGAPPSDQEDALHGLSGDSKNFKNINITVGSFINQNTNVIEKGDLSQSELEVKLRKIFFSILNDANYAAQ
jgi:TP901 family phage tail tape measure protein